MRRDGSRSLRRLARSRVERHHHRIRRELGDHCQAGSRNSVGVGLQRAQGLVFDGRAKGPERSVLADVAESRCSVHLHREKAARRSRLMTFTISCWPSSMYTLESCEAVEPTESFYR